MIHHHLPFLSVHTSSTSPPRAGRGERQSFALSPCTRRAALPLCTPPPVASRGQSWSWLISQHQFKDNDPKISQSLLRECSPPLALLYRSRSQSIYERSRVSRSS